MAGALRLARSPSSTFAAEQARGVDMAARKKTAAKKIDDDVDEAEVVADAPDSILPGSTFASRAKAKNKRIASGTKKSKR